MSADSVALQIVPPNGPRGPVRPDAIVEVERCLVGGLIYDPDQVAAVRHLVDDRDFFDTACGAVFRSLAKREPGQVDGLLGVKGALEEDGELGVAGGLQRLLELSDLATPAGLLPGMAEDVAVAAVRRNLQAALRRLDQDPTDDEVFEEVARLRKAVSDHSARRVARGLRLEEISFSGQSILSLLDEPEIPPVYPGTPPDGHFSLLIAPSFSGKTSLAIWVAMARIRGQAPWLGAPAREPGRVLFYSIDEPPGQVARRISVLAAKHPAGRFVTDYARGFVITGPHPSVSPDKLGALRFTEEGIQTLEAFLRDARAAGEPFSDVIVDAYSDLLPLGESDSNNEEATRIGGHLERLAVTYGCSIQVIHHAGKQIAGAELPDPRDFGRGASALAAKARAIFTLEEEPGQANVRRIRTRTNLTASPPPLLLEVSDQRGSGEGTRIDFFRPHDPATAYPIDDYLDEGDGWISVTQLARRLAGDADDPAKKPSGSLMRAARELRGIWDRAGLAEVRTGARNALELRRI